MEKFERSEFKSFKSSLEAWKYVLNTNKDITSPPNFESTTKLSELEIDEFEKECENMGKKNILESTNVNSEAKTLDEITSILASMGFEVKEGPHIEDEYNNFTALNISENHPARQDHDTFYLNKQNMLLRTHTSPVQIRVMSKKNLPIKIVSRIKKQKSSPSVFSSLLLISKLLNGIFFFLKTISVARF